MALIEIIPRYVLRRTFALFAACAQHFACDFQLYLLSLLFPCSFSNRALFYLHLSLADFGQIAQIITDVPANPSERTFAG